MPRNVPILLSFSAISNGQETLIHGQLTYTKINDLSFIDFGRRRTFRTLFALYRTRAYARKAAVLVFDLDNVPIHTDAHGSFYVKAPTGHSARLQGVKLPAGGEVKMVEGLYRREVQRVDADRIVVSDIDDTLIHSFINKKLRMFRTLMFTSMEKRRAVNAMFELISFFSRRGAASFYLSNSEQNLYPFIYRFLAHNNFPEGPIFLKKLRGLWEVVTNSKKPVRHLHKEGMLEEVITFFPDKEFVLMGDNTQHDLLIYLMAAEKFPGRVRQIIIRKVIYKKDDERILTLFQKRLKGSGTEIYYSKAFPEVLGGDQ